MFIVDYCLLFINNLYSSSKSDGKYTLIKIDFYFIDPVEFKACTLKTIRYQANFEMFEYGNGKIPNFFIIKIYAKKTVEDNGQPGQKVVSQNSKHSLT